jgi:hypothetical protein
MRKILICALIATSCSSDEKENTTEQQLQTDSVFTSTEVKSENTEAIEVMDFPLDSLLHFDSMAELKEVFGDDVVQSFGYFPEGMGTYPNTRLYPKTKNEVEFQWNDTINFKDLRVICIAGESCGWKTKVGITLGTTLKDLEKLNTKPFTFSGFGWDYSGTTSWDGGELEKMKIGVTLGLKDNFVEGLAGEQQFKSSFELAQKANPIVVEVTLIR